jgi:hypothetical protein
VEKKKIAREAAEAEVNSWLEYKKVNAKKREVYNENIEILIDAMYEGYLVLEEDKTFVQELRYPIGNNEVKALRFKPRLKVSTAQVCLQGLKPGDAEGRICGYIAALTVQDRNIIRELDTEDFEIARSIAIFFL